MLKVKEGQTYVCTKSSEPWWSEGKEYVVVLNSCNELCLVDDDCDTWEFSCLTDHNNQFKLKDPTIDLKAEVTYWKETSKFWKEKAKYWNEEAKFWKEKN